MAVLLTNALLVDIDPPRAEAGCLRLDRGVITDRAAQLTQNPGDEVVDCGGAVVMPGLVNGHTHLYSALAVGMPSPSREPRNFREILELVWWRLDCALDPASIEMSARIGALEALRCGTTTLIDHHASPKCIGGSLDHVRRGIAGVGLRGILCYETTDRHGRAGRDAGIAENRRYLESCAASRDGRFAGLVGAHAAFTLDDGALTELASLAREFGVGVHIHVAEDPCDEADARAAHGAALIDRLDAAGLLVSESIFAHGTHLDATAIARVNDAGVAIAHNARSNMNNAVGYAPVALLRNPPLLGTDGIGGDLFAEARAAWLISRHAQAGLSPTAIIAMWAAAARRASQSLGVTLGKLERGAAADVVLTDYVPFTPLATENLPGHLLFGIDSTRVRDVLIGGRWTLRNRAVCNCDEAAARYAAAPIARDLWRRMECKVTPD